MQPREDAGEAWNHPMLPRLVRFYKHYNPSKLVVANDMLKDAVGNEEALFEALSRKYGPEPDPLADRRPVADDAAHRRRLTRFYQRYNPHKMHEVGEVLSAFKNREGDLFAALEDKYGPELSEETSHVPAEVLHIMEENRRLKNRRQADVLWTISENHKAHTRRMYYYKWLECLWWKKNRNVLDTVVSEGRTDLLVERQQNQQLQEQVDFLRGKIKQFDVKRREEEPAPLPEPVYQPPPTEMLLSQMLQQQQHIMMQQAQQQELLNKMSQPPPPPSPSPSLSPRHTLQLPQPKPLQHYRSSLKHFPPPDDRTSIACGASYYQPTEYDKASVACGRSVISSASPISPKSNPRERRQSRTSLLLPEPLPEPTPDSESTTPITWKADYEPPKPRYPDVNLPHQHGITHNSRQAPLPSALRAPQHMQSSPYPQTQARPLPMYGVDRGQADVVDLMYMRQSVPPASLAPPTPAPKVEASRDRDDTSKNALVRALLHTHPMVQNNGDLQQLLEINNLSSNVPPTREAPPPSPLPLTHMPDSAPPHVPAHPSYPQYPQHLQYPQYSHRSETASTPPSIHVHLPQQQPRLSTRDKSRIVDELMREITGKPEKHRRSKSKKRR